MTEVHDQKIQMLEKMPESWLVYQLALGRGEGLENRKRKRKKKNTYMMHVIEMRLSDTMWHEIQNPNRSISPLSVKCENSSLVGV